MSSSARILVVDDQQLNLEVLSLRLVSQGYTVVQARDGASALQMVYSQPPDMILLDVMMPGISGREVTKTIKQDPTLPFIPIILVTAQHELNDKIDGLEAGADDFLSKPVQMRELLAKVAALLRLKRTQDALVEERNKTKLLYGIQQQLTSTLDIERVIGATLVLIVEAVQAAQGSLIMFDAKGHVVHRTHVCHGVTTSVIDNSRCPTDEAACDDPMLRERQPLLIEDMLIDDHGMKMLHLSQAPRSAMVVPLIHADVTLGVLMVSHPTPQHFTPAQLDLLTTAAGQMSTALHNASLYSLLREAEAGREQFLNMLTHDLRAPLAGILGCLHMLGESAETDDDRLFIELAQTACTTQERLIDDILDVYKAESGHMELVPTAVDLQAIGAEVVTSLRGAAAERNLELVNDLPSVPCVPGDLDKLLRVLLNLVGNALKYTLRGGVYLTAACDTLTIRVTVRDTGAGIPAHQLDKIFDRFFQGEARGMRRGSGLGLTFCQQVIAAHGGRIWAESQLGAGTQLHFCLPLKQPEYL
ncbi:MAG: response regulator [Herpetosiphonaceae bacterium]|nr:response regulator [Herpetosiphonaceae bacterium]